MRPKTLDLFLGQEHLLGPGKALGDLIRRGDVGSCIFWGPPGSGKTTLAKIIANYTERHFEPFSAVTEGVGRVREIIKEAEERLKYQGQGTILFCDDSSFQQGAAGRISPGWKTASSRSSARR
jgi:putative ATPase